MSASILAEFRFGVHGLIRFNHDETSHGNGRAYDWDETERLLVCGPPPSHRSQAMAAALNDDIRLRKHLDPDVPPAPEARRHPSDPTVHLEGDRP